MNNTIACLIALAYEDLRAETGLRNVSIRELYIRADVPMRYLHEFLLSECYAHRANPTMGEPTAASEEELRAALVIGGRPHLTIELLGL